MSATQPSVVERADTAVRYVEVADEVSQIQVAWPTLEEAVGSLQGRHFIAVFDPIQGWYRAGVEVQDDVTLPNANCPTWWSQEAGSCASAFEVHPRVSMTRLLRRMRFWSPPPSATEAVRVLSATEGSTKSTFSCRWPDRPEMPVSLG